MLQKVISTLLVVTTVMAIASLMCRLAAMHGPSTPAPIRRQHAALFGALVLSLALPGKAGHAALAVGVLVHLSYSAHRWAFGTPWESNEPPSGWPRQPD